MLAVKLSFVHPFEGYFHNNLAAVSIKGDVIKLLKAEGPSVNGCQQNCLYSGFGPDDEYHLKPVTLTFILNSSVYYRHVD